MKSSMVDYSVLEKINNNSVIMHKKNNTIKSLGSQDVDKNLPSDKIINIPKQDMKFRRENCNLF